jgi:hypothetical protein
VWAGHTHRRRASVQTRVWLGLELKEWDDRWGLPVSSTKERGKQQVTNGQRPLMMVVTAVVLAKRIKAGGQYVWRNRKWEGQRLIAGWHCGAESRASRAWVGLERRRQRRRIGTREGERARSRGGRAMRPGRWLGTHWDGDDTLIAGHDHVRREIGNGMAHGPRPSRHVATRVGCELARGSRAARAQMSSSTSLGCAEPSNACGAR